MAKMSFSSQLGTKFEANILLNPKTNQLIIFRLVANAHSSYIWFTFFYQSKLAKQLEKNILSYSQKIGD